MDELYKRKYYKDSYIPKMVTVIWEMLEMYITEAQQGKPKSVEKRLVDSPGDTAETTHILPAFHLTIKLRSSEDIPVATRHR